MQEAVFAIPEAPDCQEDQKKGMQKCNGTWSPNGCLLHLGVTELWHSASKMFPVLGLWC